MGGETWRSACVGLCVGPEVSRERFQGRRCGMVAWEWEEDNWKESVGWKEKGEWEWSSRSRAEKVMGGEACPGVREREVRRWEFSCGYYLKTRRENQKEEGS